MFTYLITKTQEKISGFFYDYLTIFTSSSFYRNVMYLVYEVNNYFDTSEDVNTEENYEGSFVLSTSFDIKTEMIHIIYILNGNKYRLKFHRKEKVNLDLLFEQRPDPSKNILSATINDEDHLRILKEYYGPHGDFHSLVLDRPPRVRDIVHTTPEEFESIELMNENVDMFLGTSLMDPIEF